MSLPIITTLWWRRYLRRHAVPFEDLERFAKARPDHRRRMLAERLLAQVRYFGQREDALPEWREAARIQDPDSLWDIWPTLPILSKPTIQSRFVAAEMAARFGLEGIVDSTGGSTGEPTRFFLDWQAIRTRTAQRIYAKMAMGWRPGMPIVIVWGSERDVGKTVSRRDRVARVLAGEQLIDGFRFSSETTERVVNEIRRHRRVAIYGYSSLLERVAKDALAMANPSPRGRVTAAWNGGEVLLPEQSRIFEAAFGTPILNHYGGRELSTIAYQRRAEGPLEVLRPWIFVEVVDKQGRPVGAGESGRILCTSTVNRGTPFLRYDIEDIGVVRHVDMSGVSSLREVQGRVAGVIELPNGEEISNIYWNHLFKEYAEVEQFQIAVTRGGLDVRLKGTPFHVDRERELRSRLAIRLGSMPVGIRWVERIPLTPQGKLVQVVREP